MKIIAEGTVSHSTEHGAYCPVITPLADGSLVAAQHIGSDLGSADNQIELLRTDSLGKPWRSQGCFNEQLRADKWAYRTPQICKGVGARLYLKANRFLFAGDSLFNADGSAQKTEILWFESEDEGNSWSSPRIIRPDVDRADETCGHTGVHHKPAGQHPSEFRERPRGPRAASRAEPRLGAQPLPRLKTAKERKCILARRMQVKRRARWSPPIRSASACDLRPGRR